MYLWSRAIRGSSALQVNSCRRHRMLTRTWLIGHTCLWLSSFTQSFTCFPLSAHSLHRSPGNIPNNQRLPAMSPSSRRSKGSDLPEEAAESSPPPKKKVKRSTKTKKSSDKEDGGSAKKASPKKKAKAPPHQRITDRDPVPKLWNPSDASEGSYSKFFCLSTGVQ